MAKRKQTKKKARTSSKTAKKKTRTSKKKTKTKKTAKKAARKSQKNGRDMGDQSAEPTMVRVLDEEGNLVGEEPTWSKARARELYRYMVLNRILDERLTRLQRQGRIGFHIWSVGEEAAIIGSCAAMKDTDWVYPCYREAGAALMRGMSVADFVHNMYGTAKDPVKGRQMPCHWYVKQGNMPSVSSPIGTQISQAAGTGLAAKIKKDPIAVMVYFGDGSTSSNEFHMGMNFAGVFHTPTVFLCRNNQWAISVPLERQTASGTIAVKAQAYGFEGVRVDGNDLLAVYEVTKRAAEKARKGGGPTLIEAYTYRMEGHSTSDDPRVYRPDSQVEPWRERDPLVRVRTWLESKGWWSEADETATAKEIDEEITAAIRDAESTPKPSLESMFDDVFAELPERLREQEEELLKAPRAPEH